MPGWTAAGSLFFAYVMVVSALLRGMPARRRTLSAAAAAAGLLLVWTTALAAGRPVLYDWLLPPSVLLVAYWTSGLLFVRPMPGAERALERVDRLLRIDAMAAASPRWLAELLELAYVGVYPLIPIALAIHVLWSPEPDPDRFWTVILVTDFICFACLPWIQTRPPRALRNVDPWVASVRRLNMKLVGRASIQVNTFPSGHAAEALAAALLVSGASTAILVSMLLVAVLISAGAVFGRYHYAADAIAGWIVAMGVWAAVVDLP